MNISLARKVLESLAQCGVQDILLCAGARNSPLVVLLEKSSGFRLWSFFEERSAGFFALGKSQGTQKPVAVMTTSGTAVAELLPVAVEATYTGTPLIFVTADRPRNYRGTGAPQSIDQVGIFSGYVETCVDIAHTNEELNLSMWSRSAPLHLNICFDEPLIDEDVPVVDFSRIEVANHEVPPLIQTQERHPNQPLVIAGPLTPVEVSKVVPHLERLGAPIYAESLSNLRNQKSLQSLLLQSGESLVRQIFSQGLCQSVVRVGGVPTLRFWRDLEEKFKSVPVHSIARTEFTGLSRPVQHLTGFHQFHLIKTQWKQDPRSQIFHLDRQKKEKLQVLLGKYPQSEVALLAHLSSRMAPGFHYLGNSLPVREWDLVGASVGSSLRLAGNRGANGIDGQISSFLGGSSSCEENWCLIGDLTALYDLSALWVTPQLDQSKLRLVVINNQGGQIFKPLFNREIFLNRHQIEFSKWAAMWNWQYERWSEVPEQLVLPDRLIIELVPDSVQSESFWQEYKNL
jgi:2-succinyl-5-enolpyruvyl-6-hydroxy-3-cyclohexene-1-carboxylate synthase